MCHDCAVLELRGDAFCSAVWFIDLNRFNKRVHNESAVTYIFAHVSGSGHKNMEY